MNIEPNYISDNLLFYNADNLTIMKQYPDKHFPLAIVDPPYGINRSKSFGAKEFGWVQYKRTEWDNNIPTKEYFDELFRVSKNQIIWGGNYFELKPTQCFIFWYKQNPVPNFSDGELAWTSFKKPASCFNYRYYGNLEGETSVIDSKTHPTQKPIALYEWILKNYANDNDKILDTHLGSGSIAIAIDKANTLDKRNLSFVGIEIDKDYFDDSIKRFKNYKSQGLLF